MRREQQKKLSTTDLKAMGLTPDLVVRKVRGARRPGARKKFVQSLTRNTTESETTGGHAV